MTSHPAATSPSVGHQVAPAARAGSAAARPPETRTKGGGLAAAAAPPEGPTSSPEEPPLPPDPEGFFLSSRPKIEVLLFFGCSPPSSLDAAAAVAAAAAAVVALSLSSSFRPPTRAFGDEEAAFGDEEEADFEGISAAAHVILRLKSNAGSVPRSSAAAPSAERCAWRAWARAGCFFVCETGGKSLRLSGGDDGRRWRVDNCCRFFLSLFVLYSLSLFLSYLRTAVSQRRRSL